MECFYPGRILIAPNRELDSGSADLMVELGDKYGRELQLAYRIEDVLQANDLSLAPDLAARGLPFVGRVRVGAENEVAAAIREHPRVGAATPDYVVDPNATLTIDQTVIDQSLAAIGAHPASPHCGSGCVVGVLDSGIDPSFVTSRGVRRTQYDALDPGGAAKVPSDRTGHGSLVARIIGEVAPGAELISIKTFENSGTISSVIAGLYLAHAAGPCQVINMSLSVRCEPLRCAVCGRTPSPEATNVPQLRYFFETFMKSAPNTVLVAASGNANSLALPAALSNIIAVGAFDYSQRTAASNYPQVPLDRYVMAPGGQNIPGAAFASAQTFGGSSYFWGTSFAAAFVTGFAAKSVCASRLPGCGTPRRGTPATGYQGPLAEVLGELYARSDQTWNGYQPHRHGLGAIRF
jgi:subtilisin family serine protease